MREPGFAGPVNLGKPVEFTRRELSEMLIELTGSKLELVEEPLPANDPRHRQPDIGLARSRLGWKLTVALRDGLERTIQDLRERCHG